MYLKNVYFITGTPYGGKATISRALAEKHGLRLYDIDEQFPIHQKISMLKDVEILRIVNIFGFKEIILGY